MCDTILLVHSTATVIYARVAQLVEHNLAKVGAAGSSPVSRLKKRNHAKHGFFFLSTSPTITMPFLVVFFGNICYNKSI